MKYFSFEELGIGLLYSLGFGAVFGLIAAAFAIAFDNFAYIIGIPKRAFSVADKPREWRSLLRRAAGSAPQGRVLNFIRDFLFTLFYGVGLIFLIYIASDGIPRAYILALSICTTALTYKLLGAYARRFFCWALVKFNGALSVIIALILFLPKRIFKRFIPPLIKRLGGFLCDTSRTFFGKLRCTGRKKRK